MRTELKRRREARRQGKAAASLEQQQYSLLDSAPIKQTRQETLVAYVQSKHDH